MERPSDPGESQAAKGERRSQPRVPIETEVSLTSESQFFTGLSGDLSTAGIFVSTYQLRKIGSRVAISFTLPNGEVHAEGIVRWVRDAREGSSPGIGIELDRIDDEDRERIATFCKLRAPLYHDVD